MGERIIIALLVGMFLQQTVILINMIGMYDFVSEMLLRIRDHLR